MLSIRDVYEYFFLGRDLSHRFLLLDV